jgi:hypothetical protein
MTEEGKDEHMSRTSILVQKSTISQLFLENQSHLASISPATAGTSQLPPDLQSGNFVIVRFLEKWRRSFTSTVKHSHLGASYSWCDEQE